jgi:hypothetical protein
LASLIWKLDHAQLRLAERTLVVLDEVGMTDDVDLARLAAHVEATGAKLVLTGDDRQLGPVGPGGALGALVARHPDAVHRLSENRRQYDTGERRALEALRAGDVGEAVSWYAGQSRVHAVATRDGALQAAVEAWSSDVAAGHSTGLYAWRRANVADLNRRARAWMETTGRLSGPELACPGGATYRAGDRVVTLAPGTAGTLVTSERATVSSVEPGSGSLVLRTDDGRHVRLSGEETGADRLGLGYATTVHRSQGSTTTRAHLFADGGGRELAYVAMSRAREHTHAWTVADDIAQAAEDLRRDWSVRRTPIWALDTGLPATAGGEVEASLPKADQARDVALALAEARISANTVARVEAPDFVRKLADAKATLRQAEQARADLVAGRGAYLGTEASQAVFDLHSAEVRLRAAQWDAEHGPRWRDRRAGTKETKAWAERVADARRRWQAHVAPEAARLDVAIDRHQDEVGRLTSSVERQAARSRMVIDRGRALRSDVPLLRHGLERYRDQLDGSGQPVPERATRPVHPRRPLPAISPSYAPDHGRGPDL